ncbi:MAG: hypothetical protein PVG66_06475 [Chromatiales bacterium]|jgi:hypothetical protein
MQSYEYNALVTGAWFIFNLLEECDMSEHDQTKNQGEGNREAAERYNEATRKFVKSGKVKEAAERAAGQPEESARWAEEQGKSRAKEFDPEVTRDSGKS